MRMNGLSPYPSSRKRGPRGPLAGITAVTTASAPLAVPRRRSSSTWASRTPVSRSSGMVSSPRKRACGSGRRIRGADGLVRTHRQVLEHVRGHGIEVVRGAPAPLGTGGRLVDAGGPGVGDGLADRVDVVLDAEARQVLADGIGEAGRRDLHRGDVEGVAVLEPRGVGLHQ